MTIKPNAIFLTKHLEGTAHEVWTLDTVGNCGTRIFYNVVAVLEPKSKNPGLKFNGTTGIRGIKRMIRRIEKERKAIGL